MSSKKTKVKKLLLAGRYFRVPSPVGPVTAACEVWLHVQIRLDTEDNDSSARGESGGHDLLGSHELEECLERVGTRIADLVEVASKTPTAAVVQAELFDGLATG